jgi:hypothetical protein
MTPRAASAAAGRFGDPDGVDAPRAPREVNQLEVARDPVGP